MGLYKELDHILTEHAKKQQRIWLDSCDIGIIVRDHNALICKEIAEILKTDYLVGGLKQHRTVTRERGNVRVRIKIYIPWEMEGDKYSCSKWEISFNKLGGKTFLQLDCQRTLAKKSDVFA